MFQINGFIEDSRNKEEFRFKKDQGDLLRKQEILAKPGYGQPSYVLIRIKELPIFKLNFNIYGLCLVENSIALCLAISIKFPFSSADRIGELEMPRIHKCYRKGDYF